MDLPIPFLSGHKRDFSVRNDDVIQLTEKGALALKEEAYTGGRAQVLMQLEDRSLSVKDIANYTRMDSDKVKDIIASLMRRAEVRRVNYEG